MDTTDRKIHLTCGIFGIAAVVCYAVGALVDLPLPAGVELLIFFGFPAFGIVQWYLYRHILSAEGSGRTGDIAFIFAVAGFTLLTAMALVQMAARLGIAELQPQMTGEARGNELEMILRGVRFVDFGLDVAWDFFIGTAFVLAGIGTRRVRGLGPAWGVPMSILGILLIALNAWTFPWPPNTRDLFDIGPICALFFFVFSVRLVFMGRRPR